jgi:hypothetical protein
MPKLVLLADIDGKSSSAPPSNPRKVVAAAAVAGADANKPKPATQSSKIGSQRKPTKKDESGGIKNRQEGAWNAQFIKLQAYKAQNGNCRVPRFYPTDPSFSSWASAVSINGMNVSTLVII